MRGVIRIGVSVVVGTLIILGALYVNTTKSPANITTSSNTTVVTEAPPRTLFETEDSNKDGIPDWREAFDTISTPTSTTLADEGDTYVPPTTLTGKFSEAFLQDYLDSKMQGQDFSDPSTFVESAVESINASVASKKHTRAELTLIPTTYESIREYGNEIGKLMQTTASSTRNEIVIFEEAMMLQDESALEALAPILKAYEDAILPMLLIEVPDTLSTQHITILNTLESMKTNIEGMQRAFDDPLYALARMSVYSDDVTTATTALTEIANIINEENITYTNEEGGSYFYIFDAL